MKDAAHLRLIFPAEGGWAIQVSRVQIDAGESSIDEIGVFTHNADQDFRAAKGLKQTQIPL